MQPADTKLCVFLKEIYQAPDVPSYKDACQRFSRVRPAPCQGPAEVLLHCLTPPPPHTPPHPLATTTICFWPLNLANPAHLALTHSRHSQGQSESFYKLTNSINTEEMSRGEEVQQILYIQSNLASMTRTAGIFLVHTRSRRRKCSHPKSSLHH